MAFNNSSFSLLNTLKYRYELLDRFSPTELKPVSKSIKPSSVFDEASLTACSLLTTAQMGMINVAFRLCDRSADILEFIAWPRRLIPD